jgi:hypothetical protein
LQLWKAQSFRAAPANSAKKPDTELSNIAQQRGETWMNIVDEFAGDRGFGRSKDGSLPPSKRSTQKRNASKVDEASLARQST